MVIVSNGMGEFVIDDEYASYSPYISAITSFTEKSRGSVDEVVIEGVESHILKNYLFFLTGDTFTMDENDENFFAFMGHPNNLEYPLDYWRLKLRSRWIRENFYRLNLCERDEGMYGLVEIPVVKEVGLEGLGEPLDTKEDGIVVAGGAALYMAGVTTEMNDIDMFSTNKEASIDWFFKIEPDTRYRHYAYKCLANSISIYTRVGVSNTHCLIADDEKIPTRRMKASLIRRSYGCPAEVVHGFDLDSSQFIVVYKKGVPTLYATEIGIYSSKNMVNWVDPEMASTTYLQRLGKYQYRGFKVMLPGIEDCNITLDRMPGLFGKSPVLNPVVAMKSIFRTNLGDKATSRDYRRHIEDWGIPYDLGSILIYIGKGGVTNVDVIRGLLTAGVSEEEMKRRMLAYDSDATGIRGKIREAEMELDVADNSPPHIIRGMGVRLDELRELEYTECVTSPWITTNPMSQLPLTGVIYPLSISDLLELYEQSPLYKEC